MRVKKSAIICLFLCMLFILASVQTSCVGKPVGTNGTSGTSGTGGVPGVNFVVGRGSQIRYGPIDGGMFRLPKYGNIVAIETDGPGFWILNERGDTRTFWKWQDGMNFGMPAGNYWVYPHLHDSWGQERSYIQIRVAY